MPSREVRRNLKRAKKPENIVEKKKESHPFLYAFSLAVLVLVVVTFIGLPLASKIGRTGRLVFGKYDGREIAYVPGNYFDKTKENIARSLEQQKNNKVNFEAQLYRVWREAFNQTVLHTAILIETQRSGIWISQDRIDKAIIKYGPYTVNGKFSEKLYNETPNSEKYKTRQYFRDYILEQQYFTDYYGGERPSSKEKKFFVDMTLPQRSFSFITLPFSNYPDKEIAAFAQKHSKLFRKIKLSRIFVNSEKDAKKIWEKLTKENGNFEELAKTYSKDTFATNGGSMGWKYDYEIKDDFVKDSDLEYVLNLKESEISKVVKGKFGWMIFRCDSPLVQPDVKDKDLLKVVKKYVLTYERGKVEDYFLKRAKDFVAYAKKHNFLDACGKYNFVPFLTNYFPINYQLLFSFLPVQSKGNKPSLATANYSKTFFEKAFSLTKKKDISDPILLEDQIVVLKLLNEKTTLKKNDKQLYESYYNYFTQQAVKTDVQNYLTNPKKLVDNFNEVFFKYISPKR